jgi:hypothetical protein
VDDWWRRQFARLLAREQAGDDPTKLIGRWLVLDMMAFARRRHRLSFEVPELIAHFLDDADIRAKDRRYAERQRASAQEWING